MWGGRLSASVGGAELTKDISNEIQKRRQLRAELYVLELHLAKYGSHADPINLHKIDDVKKEVQDLNLDIPLTENEIKDELYYNRSVLMMKERRLFYLNESNKQYGIDHDTSLEEELKQTQ